MANELTNVDEKNLSAQEQSELDTQIDALIERHKNNRFELNRLALEGATALAAGDKLTQEKASQSISRCTPLFLKEEPQSTGFSWLLIVAVLMQFLISSE
ncbi:MAG: hypothetical protein IKN27_02955, partial [Selenomonadaceae bacterium]|nr:hypothetical protein [Selenomonadaceae bacterium]